MYVLYEMNNLLLLLLILRVSDRTAWKNVQPKLSQRRNIKKTIWSTLHDFDRQVYKFAVVIDEQMHFFLI